nr:uncharacterized protein LOC106690497 [Halyomorpha halys]
MSEKEKEDIDIPPLDVATFFPNVPRCSTPISFIPDLNFLTLCDISEISIPKEDSRRRFFDVTPSSFDFSIQKNESSLRLEKMGSMFYEMRLEHSHDGGEDWLNDNHLNAHEISSRELSLRLRI